MAEASGTAGSDTGASGALTSVHQVSEQRFEHGRQLAGRIGVGERYFTLSFKLRTTDQSVKVAEMHKQFIAKFIEKADGAVSFQSTSKVEGAEKTSFTSAEEFPKQDRDHRRFFNRNIIRLKDGVHTLFRIDHKMIMADRVANVKEKLWPYLRSKNLYMINGDLIMTEHRKVAWLHGAHTSMISFSRHQDILNTMLTDCPGVKDVRQKYKNILEGDDTPLLTIVPHTISWGGPNDRVQSEVAAITAVTGHSKMMKEILMLLPPESTPYEIIPEGFAQMTSADKYKELLKAHNDAKNSVQGIAIVGMGQSDMDKKYVDSDKKEHKSVYHYISTICPGIVTVEPTKYLDSQGRWMCIVKRTSYENAKLFLSDFLENKYLSLLSAVDRAVNLGLFDTLPRIAESIPLGADMRTRVDAIDARYCRNRSPADAQPQTNAWERPRRFVFNLDDAEEFPPVNAAQPNTSNAPTTNSNAPAQVGPTTAPLNTSNATNNAASSANPTDDETRASDAQADARSTAGATAISAESTMISEMKTFMSEQSQQMSQMLEDNRKLMVTFQEMVKNSQEESKHNRELMTKMMNMMTTAPAPPPTQFHPGSPQGAPISPYMHQIGFGYGYPSHPTPASSLVTGTPNHFPLDPRERHLQLLRNGPPSEKPPHAHKDLSEFHYRNRQPPPPPPAEQNQQRSPNSASPPDTTDNDRIFSDREKRTTASGLAPPKAKRVSVINEHGQPHIVGPSLAGNGTNAHPLPSILNGPSHTTQTPPASASPSQQPLQTQPAGQPPPTPAQAHAARGITHHTITTGQPQDSDTVDTNRTPPSQSSFASSQMGDFSDPIQEEEYPDNMIDVNNEFQNPDFTNQEEHPDIDELNSSAIIESSL